MLSNVFLVDAGTPTRDQMVSDLIAGLPVKDHPCLAAIAQASRVKDRPVFDFDVIKLCKIKGAPLAGRLAPARLPTTPPPSAQKLMGLTERCCRQEGDFRKPIIVVAVPHTNATPCNSQVITTRL